MRRGGGCTAVQAPNLHPLRKKVRYTACTQSNPSRTPPPRAYSLPVQPRQQNQVAAEQLRCPADACQQLPVHPAQSRSGHSLDTTLFWVTKVLVLSSAVLLTTYTSANSCLRPVCWLPCDPSCHNSWCQHSNCGGTVLTQLEEMLPQAPACSASPPMAAWCGRMHSKTTLAPFADEPGAQPPAVHTPSTLRQRHTFWHPFFMQPPQRLLLAHALPEQHATSCLNLPARRVRMHTSHHRGTP
jgi:hypothetical protein